MEEERMKLAREMVRRQNVGAVLTDNGISDEEFVRWLEEGDMAEYLYRMARIKAMAMAPAIWRTLERMAAEGDLKAMKLYCDLCERSQSAEQAAGFSDNSEVASARLEVFGDECDGGK